MNTTSAATQANVTAATIRTWCRRGVITATKTAGRWIIDTASLAARIAIGKMKRPAKKAEWTIDTMTAIGGRRWTKAGHDRVYLNDWADLAGIETSHYGTGNISYASLGGRRIANGRAYDLLGAVKTVWFDAADGQIHFRHWGADSYEIRYRNGDRETVDLLSRITRGVSAAILAL